VFPLDGHRGLPLTTIGIGETLTVGRTAGLADRVQVVDPAVSGDHFRLTPREGALELEDLGSTNGTFVNGNAVRHANLTGNDLVRAGDSLFLVVEEEPVDLRSYREQGIVAASAPMSVILRRVRNIAARQKPVLLLGETGTGKDLMAVLVHNSSMRGGEFVPINCATIPETLAETTLFGCVAGAYTGAHSREGLIVRADQGTIFLDELGELPLKVQARLLRFLESGEVLPVGSAQPRIVNTRIVAATNRGKPGHLASIGIRQDLLARLEDEILLVPPLRERKEDIVPLMCHQIGLAGKDPLALLDADFLEEGLVYDWPRNVRQLLKTVETSLGRSAHRPRLNATELRDLLEVAGGVDDNRGTRSPAPSAQELQKRYEECKGNVNRLARHFKCHRTQVYRWMRQHKVGRYSTEE